MSNQELPFKSLEDVVKHLELALIETHILNTGVDPGRLGPNVMAMAMLQIQAASIWHYQEQTENLMKTIAINVSPID